MKSLIFKIIPVVFLSFLFAVSTNGQDGGTRARVVLEKTAKAGVFVVGKSAKYSWKATKFTAGKVAKPIVVKGTPMVAKFALKRSGTAIKRGFPIAKTAVVTYIKTRLTL